MTAKNIDINKAEKLDSGFTIIREKGSFEIIYPTNSNIHNLVNNLVLYDTNIYKDVRNYKYYLVRRSDFDDKHIKFEYIDITEVQSKLDKANALVEELNIDWTTKLPTKQKLFEDMMKYVENHYEQYGVLICDIDNFKKVNDKYGHDVGDVVLREVAETLSKGIRSNGDIIGRFGGEEFVILVKGVDEEILAATAERLRKSVDKMKGTVRVTISIGYIHSNDYNRAKNESAEEVCTNLISRADKGLYYSKENGKNCSTNYMVTKQKKI